MKRRMRPLLPAALLAAALLTGLTVPSLAHGGKKTVSISVVDTPALLFANGPSSSPSLGEAASWEFPFTDVAEEDWCYEDVLFIAQRELFHGIDAATFGPGLSMTRGMAVTVLGRMAGADPAGVEQPVFSDVDPAQYYAPYIAWAAEEELVTGRGLTMGGDQPVPYFAPDAPISRGELVVLLWRYAAWAGMDTGVQDADLSAYADGNQLPEYMAPAFEWACSAGIVRGREDNTLDQRATVTRAETAALLRRFMTL